MPLLVIDREKKTIEHKQFHDIIDYLKPGDVLVRNNTKVIPARLVGEKLDTMARSKSLLFNQIEGDVWECLVGNAHSGQSRHRLLFWRRLADLHLRQSACPKASATWNSITRGFSSRFWIS
jgi:S-adenosylmethionine:tRNA-ribosyltransferase-isomerase (queuine synthetase)